jgi:hypothetical protein
MLRVLALKVVLLALLPGLADAQTGAASITGLIMDESGAPIPRVTVTATNQATNVNYVAVSNEAGNYTIASVPVGTYVVKAELSGFQTSTTSPLTFEANRSPVSISRWLLARSRRASKSRALRLFFRPRRPRSARLYRATRCRRCH